MRDCGGIGIARIVDHLDQEQVLGLARFVRTEFGRLDVLVNDIWGGEQLMGPPPTWGRPMWELDLDAGLRMIELGIETHLRTSHALLPILVEQPGGLVVEVNDGTFAYNATHFRISVFYDLVKSAVLRLAWAQGHELAEHGGTAVAVTPGFLRSEMMLDTFQVTEQTWRDALLTDRPDGAPDRAGRVRAVGVTAVRGQGSGRSRGRSREGPVEPAVGRRRGVGARVRVHGSRRFGARLLALHRRARRTGHRRGPLAVPLR